MPVVNWTYKIVRAIYVVYIISVKMQTSHHEIEQGLKDGIYIHYWQKEDHYLCVRVKAVIEISNKVLILEKLLLW